MKFLKKIALVGLCLVITAQIASSVERDAGSKVRGEAMGGWDASSSLQSAQSHAQTLYYYTQFRPLPVSSQPTVKPTPAYIVTPAQALEQVKSIESDVSKALVSLKLLKVQYADDKQTQSEIAKIEKILADVKINCGTCAEECVKADLASAKLMECCVEMFHDLDAAHTQTVALLKHLKLDKMPEMPKKTAKTAAK